MKRESKVNVEKLNKVNVEKIAKVDLYMSDYATNIQKMSKQDLARVYGTIIDEIHSGKCRPHKQIETKMKKER